MRWPSAKGLLIHREFILFSLATTFFFSLLLYSFFFGWFGCFDADDAYRMTVDAQAEPARTVDPRFISFGLDTSKVVDSVEDAHLGEPRLLDLTRRLAPTYLRLGGTMADRLLFMEDFRHVRPTATMERCDEDNPCFDKFLPFFVMSGPDWIEINRFSREAGARLLFDFNALLRHGDEWDPTNAELLLQFTRRSGLDGNIDWQLGNEPNSFFHVFNMSVPAARLAKDFTLLKALLEKYAPSSKLVGPDTTRPQPQRPECVKYMKEFLDGFKEGPSDYIDAIAWHQYYLNGRIATLEDFWNPETLSLLDDQIDTMTETIQEHLASLPMWLTETSSAYGGGAPHLSNSFAATALWLDKLGTAASKGISVVVRQSLVGGDYSVISEDLVPLPDWWTSLLHKRLVGPKVLICNFTGSEYQRFYCQCARNSTDVTVFGINLDKYPVYFNFDGSALNNVITADEYILTSPTKNRMSKSISINGVEMKYDGNEPYIPAKKTRIRTPVRMPEFSLGFWVLRGAEMPACN